MTDLDGPLSNPRSYGPDSHMRYEPGSDEWRRYWKGQRAEGERWANEMIRHSDQHADDFRDGFLRGYLQAYADGDEYECSVEQAKIAHAKYLVDDRRGEEMHDVGGW